jgi:Na+-translocating ferredoxin:NAD+ oxidoreductase RnfG subunit
MTGSGKNGRIWRAVSLCLAGVGFLGAMAWIPSPSGDNRAAKDVLRRIFPEADSFPTTTMYVAPGGDGHLCSDSWKGDSLAVIVPSAHQTVLGYAVIDDVMGKDRPITFLLATSASLQILDLEILNYRESYGYEVGYESWQKQFYGRSLEGGIRHGREIRNISGATISCRAVTAGVRKILCQLTDIRDRLPG